MRRSAGEHKYGVKATYEVTLKFAGQKMQLTTDAWPFAPPYNFSAWSTLNQAAARTYVDIQGLVLEEPVRDVNTSLPKLIVQLGNGDMKQKNHSWVLTQRRPFQRVIKCPVQD